MLRTIDGTEVGRLVLHQLSDGNTRISITLTGLVAASQYNIVLHYATPEELGGNVQAANWGSIAGNGHLNFDWYGLPNGLRQNYQDMQTFDGHMRVVDINTSVVVATADIGQNQLTGRQFELFMAAVSDTSIFGTLQVHERKSGFALVQIALRGTQPGNRHPAHYHLGGSGLCGTVSISLNDVEGSTGISKSTVKAHDLLGVRNEGVPITYNQLAAWAGCVEVHKSSSQLSTLIALH